MNVLEIALLIILPLIIFYQRNNCSSKIYIKNIFVLYLIWYTTYALLHELSHLVGAWMTGANVVDYQLIPHFWKGDFKTGYVKTIYSSMEEEFFIVILPYIRDVLFAIFGCLIIWKKKFSNSLLIGFILVIFIFSPVYDVINNYVSYLCGALNDFNAIKITTNRLTTNIIGIVFSLITICVGLFAIFYNKSYESKCY